VKPDPTAELTEVDPRPANRRKSFGDERQANTAIRDLFSAGAPAVVMNFEIDELVDQFRCDRDNASNSARRNARVELRSRQSAEGSTRDETVQRVWIDDFYDSETRAKSELLEIQISANEAELVFQHRVVVPSASRIEHIPEK